MIGKIHTYETSLMAGGTGKKNYQSKRAKYDNFYIWLEHKFNTKLL